MMQLKYDPFPLVLAEGDAPTQLAYLTFFGLEDSPRAKDCLVDLIKQQRSDGAFPSQLDPDQWGMRETVRNTLLLLRVGLPPKGANVGSAVRFVLRQQRQDGGWSENPALELPAEQTWLSNERSITWLTADVVDLLGQAGMREGAACEAAVEWLRSTQNRHGGWPSLGGEGADPRDEASDPDATAQIAFLMGELHGLDDPGYLRGRALFESHLDKCVQDVERGYRVRWRDGKKEELDVYTLTHLLLSWPLDEPRRFQRGYDASDHRIRRMMEALIDLQREDGGWRPFWAEESDPVYTLLAIKGLVLAGMLARGGLVDAARSHALH
jgi:hypothetical protein